MPLPLSIPPITDFVSVSPTARAADRMVMSEDCAAHRHSVGSAAYLRLRNQHARKTQGLRDWRTEGYGLSLPCFNPIGLAELEALETRHRDLVNYLNETAKQAAFTSAAQAAKRMWGVLWEGFFRSITVPYASTGDGGGLLLFWRSERHYAEIEFEPNRSWSFFFEDMSDPETFIVREYEGAPNEVMPPEEFAYLIGFVSAPAFAYAAHVR